MKKYLIFALILIWSQFAHSYVHNQTKNGVPLHWPGSSNVVDIFVNTQNDQGIAGSDVQTIATSSLREWNNLANITIRTNTTTGKNQDDLNELYFSKEPSIFNGTGVIGITLVGYSETSGEIVSADILISDNLIFSTFSRFSTDITSTYYLGNVITHEAGHFLGLGHGQVAGSTMFYALTRGQNKVDEDDKSGLYSIYPTGDTTKGALTGTIVGGKNLALVFGAHVQAISVKTGKVMGAAISELNGKFKIDGLPKDDQYLIYNSPLKQVGLPTTYANARSDFCESSSKYRGSFFQSCGSSSEGFPEAVRLNSSLVDTGNITIRCGLDTPPDYFQNKSISPSSFNINSNTNSGLGGSFVGFFTSSEIQQSKIPLTDVKDSFLINFSNFQQWDSLSTLPLYVELKVTNQAFSSVFKALVNVKRQKNDFSPTYVQSADGSVNIDTFVSGSVQWDSLNKYVLAPDGWVNVDSTVRIPISRLDPSDNNFEIKISPNFSNTPSGIPVTDLFTDLQESMYFYLVTATIVRKNLNGTFTQVSSKNDLLSDNTMCPDAVNTYALTSFSAKGASSSSDRKAAGCGTVIDTSNGAGGSGGGPGGFMVGILLCFIVSYALSRYSKMA
ncbi:MAG: matrixin family metalloprotease [Bacteriovorax sp.]|nr:matrixin family metalloprotease [Bacteriovorax sp.]